MLIRTIQTDTLFSSVYDSRSSMGYAAAEAAASAIRAVLDRSSAASDVYKRQVQWDTLPQKRRPAPFAQFWNGRKLQM